MAFILDEIEQGRHMVACESEPCDGGELFRTDAKGETGRVTIGGWESRGTPKESRWFSLRIDADQAPWLFREGEGSRTIATGELLATLVACQLFVPAQSGAKQRASCRVTGKTDNRGNSFIVKKMMTTKFPLALVLMQLSRLLARRRMVLDLQWCKREENSLADDLTNEDFAQFCPENRLHIEYKDIDLGWASQALLEEASFRKELEALK
eukprot:1183982-Amphidinium_carterae.1